MAQFFGAPWKVRDVGENMRWVAATTGPAASNTHVFNANANLEKQHEFGMKEATYLVAAAPELFNALSALVNALTSDDAIDNMADLVEQGDAALRKATEWVGNK